MTIGDMKTKNRVGKKARIQLGKVARIRIGIVFVVTMLGALCIAGFFLRMDREKKRERMEYISQTILAECYQTLTEEFDKFRIMETYLLKNEGKEDGFDQIAKVLLRDNKIKNLIFAPDGVVKKVYPADFRVQSAGNRILLRETFPVLENDTEIYMKGPVNIAPGLQGLFGCSTVYIEDSSGKSKYWGMVLAILDVNKIFEGNSIFTCNEKGYSCQVWKQDESQEHPQMIMISNGSRDNHMFVDTTMTMHNEVWHATVSPLLSWYKDFMFWTPILVAVLLSILSTIVVYSIEHSQNLQYVRFQAEQENQAKSTFLYNMSHDIRTPMNAIVGYTAMAKKHIQNPDLVRDYLGKLSQAENHLSHLLNDLLDLSRIENGKFLVHTELSDVIEKIDEFTSLIEQSAEERGITVNIDYSSVTERYVIADVVHINQVMVNIFSNAIKYSNPGGAIDFTAIQREVESEWISFDFVVKDYGIGISEEALQHICEPFWRDKRVMKMGVPGTGLGLAISRNMVEQMGGELEICSQLNRGTTVTVHWKWRRAAQQVEAKEEAVSPVELMGKHILLVEDNELNQEIAIDLLQDSGMIVETAEDGERAIELLKGKEGVFDCILLDIQMPKKNGYDTAREIRSFKAEYWKRVPILAMTANAFEEDRLKALEMGMNAHIAKPLDERKVLETIQKCIQEERQIK